MTVVCMCFVFRWQHPEHTLFWDVRDKDCTDESVRFSSLVFLPVSPCSHTGKIRSIFIQIMLYNFFMLIYSLFFFLLFFFLLFPFPIFPHISQMYILVTAGHLKVPLAIWWSVCVWRSFPQPFPWNTSLKLSHLPATSAAPHATSQSM